MKLIKISPNILHFRAKNQRVLTSSFVRMQEFYECPMKEFRGKFFTLKEFKRAYAKEFGKGKFTYFTDWHGFNVPGRIVRNFWFEFDDAMSRTERAMKRQILKALKVRGQDFYLIGTHREIDLDHEIAHAMWYLNKDYQNGALDLIDGVPEDWKEQAYIKLGERGYHYTMFLDEIHTYLSTSTILDAMDNLGKEIDLPYDIMKDLQLHFRKYKGNLNV